MHRIVTQASASPLGTRPSWSISERMDCQQPLCCKLHHLSIEASSPTTFHIALFPSARASIVMRKLENLFSSATYIPTHTLTLPPFRYCCVCKKQWTCWTAPSKRSTMRGYVIRVCWLKVARVPINVVLILIECEKTYSSPKARSKRAKCNVHPLLHCSGYSTPGCLTNC